MSNVTTYFVYEPKIPIALTGPTYFLYFVGGEWEGTNILNHLNTTTINVLFRS